MNVFSRSWEITKLTFKVINQDRELLAFALLSFVFSAMFAVAMIVPTVLPDLISGEDSISSLEVYQYVLLFVTYLGMAMIATFFNVCVVYTTKVRFEGGNATFNDSIKFAFSKFGLILKWSLLSACVGVILKALEQVVSSFGKVGEIVGSIIIGLMGAAWSVATIFVVPILVYDGLGPIDSVKKSIEAVKLTWGEHFVRSIGLRLMTFLSVLLALGIGVGLTVLLAQQFDIIGGIIGAVIGACLVLFTGLLFKTADTIFSTALFVYASEKMVAPGFSEDIMTHAFKPKKK